MRTELVRAALLRAEAHELLAKGHAKLAEAERLATSQGSSDEAPSSWLPAALSPLGNRATLKLARTGAIESSKIGRKVLVRRASLEGYLRAHARGADAANDGTQDENLFGVAS